MSRAIDKLPHCTTMDEVRRGVNALDDILVPLLVERSGYMTQAARVKHCVDACFNGKRIVVFSGGAAKGTDAVFDDARAIRDGGGNGSIIGRNSFQRSREDALAMLGKLIDIYQGKE